MSTAVRGFYVTGGTLRQDAPSYVERQADRELYEGLLQGEYCYVLHARQMGKSSLMVHATARLRKEGVAVVNLDLTRLGQNLTVEQWYDGLLGYIGQQLNLEDETEEFWLAHERLSPLQHFLGALEHIVLARCPGRIVLFLDEIDAVRSLPFSTDEFFAAIRECYNRRTQEPAFERLTFCLLGVATPSDLIQDTRTTPFNIGRRIELTDFTPAEAAPLAAGLGREERTNRALLERVLYWTGGHPYLTQRLCQAVASDPGVADAAGVDRHCEALFLSRLAQEKDDNLLFVRDRLLRNEAEVASLLDLYAQVRRGRRVAPDDTNQLVSLLRLSGITQVVGGSLRVRNRIYERVFDPQWITQHMPDAELRRQKAAFRRGLLRASAVATVIVAVMAGLALIAVNQARLARVREREARRERYAAQMNLAQQAWEVGNVARAQELVAAQKPHPGEEDLRGFEWRYLWRLCQGDARWTLRGHSANVNMVAFSRDGKLLASASDDRTVKLWDAASKQELATLNGHTGNVTCVAFSPDGKTLATCSADMTVRLWDVSLLREDGTPKTAAGQRLSCTATLNGHTAWVNWLAFSSDGKILASASLDNTVRLWDVPRRRPVDRFHGGRGGIFTVALSPDGRAVAAGGRENVVWLWDRPSRRRVAVLRGHTLHIDSLKFSPDGRMLASGSQDSSTKLWDVATRREIATLRGHTGYVDDLAFSADGKFLATAGSDGVIKLWDVAALQEITTLRGHLSDVNAVAFAPAGRTLASGSSDHTVKLWDTTLRREAAILRGHRELISELAFTPDGRTLASTSREGVKIWDIDAQRELAMLPGTDDLLAISPDGKTLAAGDPKQAVNLWELGTRRLIAGLFESRRVR